MSTTVSKQNAAHPADQQLDLRGAVTLDVSINDTHFDLIYCARDEAFDGSPQQIAGDIMDFAKRFNCRYGLLLENNCWISANRGISILAQIESQQHIKQYDRVVLPLDDAVYMADMADELVTAERVQPIDQAMAFLSQHSNNVAVLQGGRASHALAQQGFEVNCEQQIVIAGKEAAPYRYSSIYRLLAKHRLYHPKLLMMLGIFLAVPLLILALGVGLLSSQTKPEAVVQPVIRPASLKNSTVNSKAAKNTAGHRLQQISPWLTGNSLDFLRSCRLSNISIVSSRITYNGEKMNNTDKQLLGCGYDRLRQISRERQLQLSMKDYNWSVLVNLSPVETQAIPRPAFVETMDRLALLASYMGWQFSVNHTAHQGINQQVSTLFSGNLLTTETIAAMSEIFLSLPARLEKVTLLFNPDNFALTSARFEITVFTTSGTAP